MDWGRLAVGLMLLLLGVLINKRERDEHTN